jgi:DNA-binding IclR family transcriptional regulator
MRDQPGSNLQSVRRALRALELISESGECGVTELGRKLGVHKATASRLVATLAERGFVERDPSPRSTAWVRPDRPGGGGRGGNDLVRSARPSWKTRRAHPRTVNVGVLSGDAVVYVDQVAAHARSSV